MSGHRVCLDCRTVVGDRDACVDPDHRVVSLIAPEGHAALVEAVWGAQGQRRDAVAALRRDENRQLLLSFTGFVFGAGGTVFLGPASTALAMIGGAAGAAAGHVAGRLRARRRRIEYPRGAREAALPTPSGRGRIRRADELESPASGVACAAWAVELRYEGIWGDRVMLRAAESRGLDVTLDGGAAARIPPGPLRVLAPLIQLDDVEGVALERYLHHLDPRRGDDREQYQPIPHNVVVEHTLMVGDRIELLGPLEPSVVTTATAKLYRDAPATVLVPRGMPVIRLLG